MPVRRAFLWLIALAAVAAIGLLVFSAIAEGLFWRRHPAPGRLISIGRSALHIQCSGTGSPAVIFESGMGGSSLDWYAVQPEVARFTRACAYDRAGAGWSDAAPPPRDPARNATELHTLLANAGVAGPYVLVGHSYGGYLARVFAGRYRDEMAGLVLVDVVTPEMPDRIPAIKAQWAEMARDCGWDRLRAMFGIFRLRGDSVTYAPSEIRPIADGFFMARKSQADSCSEIRAMNGEGKAQVRAVPSFGALPLAVVTAGKNEFLDAEGVRIWQELQRDLLGLSSRSTQTFAKNSTHQVQFIEPGVIVGAVRDVVATAAR